MHSNLTFFLQKPLSQLLLRSVTHHSSEKDRVPNGVRAPGLRSSPSRDIKREKKKKLESVANITMALRSAAKSSKQQNNGVLALQWKFEGSRNPVPQPFGSWNCMTASFVSDYFREGRIKHIGRHSIRFFSPSFRNFWSNGSHFIIWTVSRFSGNFPGYGNFRTVRSCPSLRRSRTCHKTSV